MANFKYTISFLPSDKELLHFVKEKRRLTNFSAYVRELIRRDMNNQDGLELEQIYGYIITKLKEEGFAKITETESGLNSLVDEMDKGIIKDLF